MSNTTLTQDNLLMLLQENPWMFPYFLLLDAHYTLAHQEQREQVRQRLVAEHLSAPLYQARAAKDLEYWNKFYLGQVR